MQEIERLFREFHTPLVRYLTRQLNDADLAEELAQETFVRAMRHQPLVHERAWLFAVATNLIRDLIRRETRQRRHLMALHADAAHASKETDDVSPDDARRAVLAREALHDIPERDRAALYMSQEGLNYQEIAAALGLSVQSVGTTLTRARKKVVRSYEGRSRAHESGGANAAS
jgi:RNA polymerase sigma-70 factor (ECF subfamily)